MIFKILVVLLLVFIVFELLVLLGVVAEKKEDK